MRTREEVAPASIERTEVVVLLDRSGSMSSVKAGMEEGFDAFLKEQREAPGECLLTLVQFDTGGIETVHESKPIQEVPRLDLQPRGGTPLIRAMHNTLTNTIQRLKDAVKVIFVVITDGHETEHPSEFTRAGIKALVEQQTAKGWLFVYLGANVDSFAEGASFGAARGLSANYLANTVGASAAMDVASKGLLSYRGMSASKIRADVASLGAVNMAISDEDRKKLMGDLTPDAGNTTGGTK